MQELNYKIDEWKEEAVRDIIDIGKQWKFVKFTIGEFSRDFGAKIKKQREFCIWEKICNIHLKHSNNKIH